MQIILDKSFLLGAPRLQLASLFQNHHVFMTDVLFYEIFKDETYRQRLFARIPRGENPLHLLQGTGEILRFEIERRARRAVKLSDVLATDGHWRFHPGLADGTFEIESWMHEETAAQHAEYLDAAKGVAGLASTIPTVFPSLRGHSPGLPGWKARFSEAADVLGRSDEAVLEVYRYARANDWPRSNLHRGHALFRTIQVTALLALSAYQRYGLNPPKEAVENSLEHDARDRDYALPSLLCGAVATKDRRLADLVLRAEPTATIIGMGPTKAVLGRHLYHS